jgi:hypothetical protein
MKLNDILTIPLDSWELSNDPLKDLKFCHGAGIFTMRELA